MTQAAESEPVGGVPSIGRRRALRGVRVAGSVLALAAVVLCASMLASQWSQVRSAVANADVRLLVAALGLTGLAVTGLGVLWWRSLELFGGRRALRQVLSWYFAGELGKYLPGSIWPVVGRGELAVRGGVRRAVGYATTLLAYGVMCVAAAAVCGVLAPFVAADGHGIGWTASLLLVVPLGVVVVHPAVFGRILALARRVSGGRVDLDPPPWGRMLGLIGYLRADLGVDGSGVGVGGRCSGVPTPSRRRVAFAAVLAWVVGFLAVPVPAGAGVRELVFVGVCGLALGPAAAVAAITRLLFIVIDAAGGVVGLLYLRRMTVVGRQARAAEASGQRLPCSPLDPPATQKGRRLTSRHPVQLVNVKRTYAKTVQSVGGLLGQAGLAKRIPQSR